MKHRCLAVAAALVACACSKQAPTTTNAATTPPSVKLAADSFRASHAGGQDGAIVDDAAPDAAIDVNVGGAVKAIGLLTVDAAGKPSDGQQWDTWVGDSKIPAAIGTSFATGGETWQLAVLENGAVKNAADGTLAPLPATPHTLTVYATDSGHWIADRRFAIFVERPDGKIERSNIFQIVAPPPQ